MDLPNHYKLAGESSDHFMVHDSRDKKTFKIAKKPLHPAHQLKILRLQKFSDGGEVQKFSGESDDPEDSVVKPAEEAAPEQAAPPPMPMLDLSGQTPGALPPTADQGWHAPMLPGQVAPQPAPQGGSAEGQMSVKPTSAPGSQYAMPGMDQMVQGIKQSAGAQAQLGKNQEDAIRNFQQQEAVHNLNYQDNYKKIEDEQAGLQQQLQAGKIDPRRYFNNMDTGHRISTAISLILGGIGAGLTHGPNVALQLMNKAVDNDIEAQKQDLGKTHSLLSLNMQKYHNLQTAEAATRLHYNTILQTQLQAAQAKATNGAAAGALQMQLGKMVQEDAIYKNQIALQTTHAQSLGMGSSTGEGGIPVGQESGLLLLDPKYRETRVVANGKAYSATDKEAADKVRSVETLAGPVVDGIQRLKQLADDPSSKFQGTPSNLESHSIMAGLSTRMPLLAGSMIGAKRVNDAEVKAQAERFQDPTRFDQTLGGVKSDNFLNELEKEVEGMRTNHLVGYKGGAGAVPSLKPATGKLPRN